jgi:hypothetical protein
MSDFEEEMKDFEKEMEEASSSASRWRATWTSSSR